MNLDDVEVELERFEFEESLPGKSVGEESDLWVRKRRSPVRFGGEREREKRDLVKSRIKGSITKKIGCVCLYPLSLSPILFALLYKSIIIPKPLKGSLT